MQLFTERHAGKIRGVLSCYDRVVITGTCPAIGHAEAATTYFYIHQIRIFDYAQWASSFRDEIRANAERMAQENGLEIEFIRKKNFRKEDRIKAILEKRGEQPGSIKMYDKHGIILRIETTANDVSFFKHYRKVEHRDGPASMAVAPVRKTIYSLTDLLTILGDSNRRYLEFISAIDDPTPPLDDLNKISRPVHDGERTYRGFNLFHGDDLEMLRALIRGEFNISGFTNRQLQDVLPSKTGRQLSVLLKRLYKHGLIKRIRRTYKYYLTALGKRVATAALKLREMAIIPLLRGRLAL